jgi:hypothetical protein
MASVAAEVVRGVNSNILAALIGGGLALSGLLVERVLRSFGRLWCEPWGWRLIPVAKRGRAKVATRVPEEEAKHFSFSGKLDFFNGKEIPVGLRNVRIVFVCDNGIEVDTIPADAEATWTYEASYDPHLPPPTAWGLLHLINLPPRQWVIKDLEGRIEDPEEVRLLHRWRRMEFVAERQKRGLFESKVLRKTLAWRTPYPDPWKGKTT